uniref:Putative ovule protein n=1 Tax=Solanum chacoense TaxID=4108 RepID=A0A0V0HTR7_SOLCH
MSQAKSVFRNQNSSYVMISLAETTSLSLSPRGRHKVCVHPTLPRPHLMGFVVVELEPTKNEAMCKI